MTIKDMKEFDRMQIKEHIMVDCETLSTAHNPVLLSIGAIDFDETGVGEHKFYMEISIQSCLNYGLRIDESTLCFWMKQPEKESLILRNRGDKARLGTALTSFESYIFANNNMKGIWSNGALADLLWLREAYNTTGIEIPWTYKQERCFRTLFNLYPKIKGDYKGTKHNAFQDAKMQAYQAAKILNFVKFNKSLDEVVSNPVVDIEEY